MHTCAWINVSNCPYSVDNYKSCPYSKHGYAKEIKVPLWCLHRTASYEHVFQQPPYIAPLEMHMINPSEIDETIQSPTIYLNLPLEGQPSLDELDNWKPLPWKPKQV